MGQENRHSSKRNARRLIAEALREARQEQKKTLRTPPDAPEWPYWYIGDDFDLRAVMEGESRTIIRRKLIWRLKRFRYPYPNKSKKPKSFYRHLTPLGLLHLLFQGDLLWTIKFVWHFTQDHKSAMQRYGERRSLAGYPLQLHRKLLFLMAGHLTRIDRITRERGVPRRWYRTYRSAVLKEILRNAANYYSESPSGLVPAQQPRTGSSSVSDRLELLDEIEYSFRTKNITNHRLALQLTALICTSSEDIRANRLNPTPENVRANVRDARKGASKRKTRKNRKVPAQKS
jgi:hypothetical protein